MVLILSNGNNLGHKQVWHPNTGHSMPCRFWVQIFHFQGLFLSHKMKSTLSFLFLSIINMVCVGSRKVKSTFVISTCARWCCTYSRTHMFLMLIQNEKRNWQHFVVSCQVCRKSGSDSHTHTETHTLHPYTPAHTPLDYIFVNWQSDEGQWKRKK